MKVYQNCFGLEQIIQCLFVSASIQFFVCKAIESRPLCITWAFWPGMMDLLLARSPPPRLQPAPDGSKLSLVRKSLESRDFHQMIWKKCLYVPFRNHTNTLKVRFLRVVFAWPNQDHSPSMNISSCQFQRLHFDAIGFPVTKPTVST